METPWHIGDIGQDSILTRLEPLRGGSESPTFQLWPKIPFRGAEAATMQRLARERRPRGRRTDSGRRIGAEHATWSGRESADFLVESIPKMLSRRAVHEGLAASLFCAVGAKAQPGPSRPALRVAVWDSASKFVQPARVVDDPEPVAVLFAARNEYETFQILLQADDGAVGHVELRRGPLSKPDGEAIAEASIEVFLVHYAAVDTPSDSLGRAGVWPDALIPIAEPIGLPAGTLRAIWVRVRIDARRSPGLYRGNIDVVAKGQSIRKVQVEVNVFGVTLPDNATLPFIVGLDWESIYKGDGAGLKLESFASRIAPAYYSALRAAGVFPFNLLDAMPRLLPGNERAYDFALYDKRLREAQGDRSDGPIPLPFGLGGPIDPRQFEPFSEAWERQVVNYLAQAAAHLAAGGNLDRAFIYFAEADEPTRSDQVHKIAALHRLAEEADPRLRVVQTIHARCFDCDFDVLPVLDSPVTLWVPNVAFHDGYAVGVAQSLGFKRVQEFASGWSAEFERQVRASGRSVWIYLNAATAILPAPNRPYPSLYIDHDAMAHRLLGWMAWDRQIAGVGHWMATYWRGPGSPWDAVPRGEGGKGANGDGVLLYPANGADRASGQPIPEGPVGSIRLECIREAGEDHKLLSMAERRLGRSATKAHARDLISRTEKVLLDPRPMRTARETLLKELAS